MEHAQGRTIGAQHRIPESRTMPHPIRKIPVGPVENGIEADPPQRHPLPEGRGAFPPDHLHPLGPVHAGMAGFSDDYGAVIALMGRGQQVAQ